MAAVEVRSGYKYYGRSKDRKVILNHLDMNVYSGSIYGLLGASGCGKTTLLSCIVGVRKFNSGKINVLGGQPGTQGSGVPGPRIGYMPQEIALIEEFTIKETIYYFGRIYGMDSEKLRTRYRLLHDLLDLPDEDRFVGVLSGGQMRRVSFACAFIHEPELVILDEPTVGLDPILRERIWQFLVETTLNGKIAVIITTHYIDEAKLANRIGLMRNGILLAEDSPQNILITFNKPTLEDAFLILSQKQGKSEEASETLDRIESARTIGQIETNEIELNQINNNEKPDNNKVRKSLPGRLQLTTKARLKTLIGKNILQLIRQPVGIIFCFLFPILQLSCFYSAIGGNPKDLEIGVVNREVNSYMDCYNDSLITTFAHDYTCDLHKVSCRYLGAFGDDVAKKVYFDTYEEAYAAAKKAKIIGFIHFAENFTESIESIRDEGRHADEGSFINTDIEIRLDMANQQIAFFLEKKFRQAYKTFAENLMEDCQFPKQLGNIPMRFETPVYGKEDEEYTTFVAPGIIMTMVFFLATLTTATVFITERLQGIWDRILVAGIKMHELLVAHILTQVIIIFVQSVEIVVFAAFCFGVENKGETATIIGLLVLLGFAGMLFGLLVSIICDSHTMASFVATGSFYPMIIMCGLLWPLEGMPVYLKYLAYTFPFTIPSISVRNVLIKGWSFTHFEVYGGFAVLIGWILIFLILCLVGLRAKN